MVHLSVSDILMAGALEEAPPRDPARTLVTSADTGFDRAEARAALHGAGDLGSIDERLAHGDQFWAWRIGGDVVCYGFITWSDRAVGKRRFSVVPGRAFLFGFHTLAAWRNRGLCSSLLLEIRHRLPASEAHELVADVPSGDVIALRALARAGFKRAARTSTLSVLDRFSYAPLRGTREYVGAPLRCLFQDWTLVEPGSPPPAATPSTVGLDVDVIDGLESWDEMRHEWEELFTHAANPAPPLGWSWLRGWWGHYGDTYGSGPRALRVMTVRRGGKLVGLLPLYLRRPLLGRSPVRELAFISTGERAIEETCADYLDLLHLPGEGEACSDVLQHALFQQRRVAFDRLTFDEISTGSPLVRWLGAAPAGYTLFRRDRGACPAGDLSGGIDAWLMRLPSRKRTQPRRLLREADQAGAVLELACTPEQVAAFYDEMVQLHQSRWIADGMPGAFATARFTDFHRQLAFDWVPVGRAVLARVTVGGHTMSVVYGFVNRGKFDFYQAGTVREDSAPLKSPGITAHLLLMRHLAQRRDIVAYDFLRGSSTYKQRLTTVEQGMIGLRFERDGLRNDTGAAIEIFKKAVRAATRVALAAVRRD